MPAVAQGQTRSRENPGAAYLQLSYATAVGARGRDSPLPGIATRSSGLHTLTGAGGMPRGGVRGAGATLAGSPLLSSGQSGSKPSGRGLWV